MAGLQGFLSKTLPFAIGITSCGRKKGVYHQHRHLVQLFMIQCIMSMFPFDNALLTNGSLWNSPWLKANLHIRSQWPSSQFSWWIKKHNYFSFLINTLIAKVDLRVNDPYNKLTFANSEGSALVCACPTWLAGQTGNLTLFITIIETCASYNFCHLVNPTRP